MLNNYFKKKATMNSLKWYNGYQTIVSELGSNHVPDTSRFVPHKVKHGE